MAASTETASAFPSPYEIATPPGCEGWEEMYPHYALFARRAARPTRPALVLELDALPGADAGVRHGLVDGPY